MVEITEHEAQLSVRDQVNFPYLLANQILTFQKSLLAEEYSEREIQETIQGFIHLIPAQWKDNQFNTALKEATKKIKIDIRPMVVPTIKLSVEKCEELGIATYKEDKEIDYYLIFQACIDLLLRRGLLTRVHRVEVLEGVDFDTVAIPPVLEG